MRYSILSVKRIFKINTVLNGLTIRHSHLQQTTTYLRFLMAVVPTQQPAHNENEHASCELKLELKGHTAQVLSTKKTSVKLK